MKLSFLFWQRETWRAFWRRPASFIPVLIALIFVGLNWFIAAKLFRFDTVIMRYSIYVGTNWLAPGNWIFILPGLTSLIVLVDFALAYLVARSSLALRYLWLWSAVFVSLGACWLAWLLLRINT